MFNSPALETAIGLVFCFASVALIASAAKEAVSSMVSLRAKTLLTGIKNLLNDPNFNGLALGIYNHALVNPRGDGKAVQGNVVPKTAPSYVEPKYFAIALVDTLQKVPGDVAQIKAGIDNIPDEQLRTLFQGMYARSNGDLENLEAQIAEWFDSGMNRLSGLYKRYAQVITFIAGLAIASVLNIDSLHLCRELWKHPAQVAQISAPVAQGSTAEGLPVVGVVAKEMANLPIGRSYLDLSGMELFWNVIGILLTASAAMFGAPFWFDMLQSLVQLRSSGPKPGEKTEKSGEKPVAGK